MITLAVCDLLKNISTAVAIVICLQSCQIRKSVNPLKPEVQGLVGKYFSIKNIRILASQNPNALWNYEVTMIHMVEQNENDGTTRSKSNRKNLLRYNDSGNFVDLNEKPGEKSWGKEIDNRLFVKIIDCDKVNAEVPLVKVKVLNKMRAGSEWWMTGKDLYWGDEIDPKDFNFKP